MVGTPCLLRTTVLICGLLSVEFRTSLIDPTDNPRSVSRYCSDSEQYRKLSAKLLCLLQTTLSGTLFVFQGEELGQRNMPLGFDPSEYRDIESINYWDKASPAAQTSIYIPPPIRNPTPNLY